MEENQYLDKGFRAPTLGLWQGIASATTPCDLVTLDGLGNLAASTLEGYTSIDCGGGSLPASRLGVPAIPLQASTKVQAVELSRGSGALDAKTDELTCGSGGLTPSTARLAGSVARDLTTVADEGVIVFSPDLFCDLPDDRTACARAAPPAELRRGGHEALARYIAASAWRG